MSVRASMRRRAKAKPNGDSTQTPDPHQGGPRETMGRERASASPRLPQLVARGTKRVARVPIRPAAHSSLRQLQEWFAAIIMHPQSAEVGAVAAQPLLRARQGVDDILTAGPTLSASQRIAIYHYGYHARLIDCLIDDFPTLHYALGHEAFEHLARKVIAAHPSDQPNLNFFGTRMLTYTHGHAARLAHGPFIADLARLEWAMGEVLHARAAPTLSTTALQAITPEQWASMRFQPSQTVRVLRFAYPVNRFLQHFRDDKQPAIPRKEATATAVYRRGYAIWRMDLSAPMAEILDSLFAGKPLGEALAGLVESTNVAEQQRMAQLVMVWFRDWVDGGFFAAFHGEPSPRPVHSETRRRPPVKSRSQAQHRR